MELGELNRLVQMKLQAVRNHFRCSLIPKLFDLKGRGRFNKNEHTYNCIHLICSRSRTLLAVLEKKGIHVRNFLEQIERL